MPRYLGILQSLEEEVDTLPPNSLMPTEHQLAKRFDVSRVTMRRVLGFLERSGKISRQRGRGTIVSPPKVTRHIVPVHTIEQDFRNQGLKLETHALLYQPKTKVPEHIRQRLQLGKGKSAGLLSLTRMVHDRVICFEQRYFPPAIATRFDPTLIDDCGVIDALVKLAGMPITEYAWEMQIIPVRAEVAKALSIVPGNLTIVHTFTNYLGPGNPLEAGMVFYRIDRVRFELVASAAIQRPNPSSHTQS